MEYPSTMSISPFDQAAHSLALRQQQKQQQQQEAHYNFCDKKRQSWSSWFRKSSTSASTATSAIPSSCTATGTGWKKDNRISSSNQACFTGGLSIDYRDCEAPMSTTVVTLLPSSSVAPPVYHKNQQEHRRPSFCSLMSSSDDDDDDDEEERNQPNKISKSVSESNGTRRNSSHVMRDIELQWEASSSNDESSSQREEEEQEGVQQQQLLPPSHKMHKVDEGRRDPPPSPLPPPLQDDAVVRVVTITDNDSTLGLSVPPPPPPSPVRNAQCKGPPPPNVFTNLHGWDRSSAHSSPCRSTTSSSIGMDSQCWCSNDVGEENEKDEVKDGPKEEDMAAASSFLVGPPDLSSLSLTTKTTQNPQWYQEHLQLEFGAAGEEDHSFHHDVVMARSGRRYDRYIPRNSVFLSLSPKQLSAGLAMLLLFMAVTLVGMDLVATIQNDTTTNDASSSSSYFASSSSQDDSRNMYTSFLSWVSSLVVFIMTELEHLWWNN
ncbi:hypothetical protein ACA910_015155 [Epithemia clementina (nom. ined.)]